MIQIKVKAKNESYFVNIGKFSSVITAIFFLIKYKNKSVHFH